LIVLFGLFGTLLLNAQNKLVESNSIVGIWRQVIPLDTKVSDAEFFKTNNYKVINTDGSYFTLLTTGSELVKLNETKVIEQSVTNIGHYGTYTNLSENSYSENIIRHGLKSDMNETSSEMRYDFLDKNTLLLKYNIGDKWIPELWKRVTLVKRSETN